jgi:hypothetical protein
MFFGAALLWYNKTILYSLPTDVIDHSMVCAAVWMVDETELFLLHYIHKIQAKAQLR